MYRIEVELPKHPVGTVIKYRDGDATISGYNIEHDTETGATMVTYVVTYDYLGQKMHTRIPRSTVDRQLLTTTA